MKVEDSDAPSGGFKDFGQPWLCRIPDRWNIAPFFSCFSERDTPNVGIKLQNVLSLSYGRIIARDVDSNHGLLPESFETYNIVEPNDIVMRLTDLQNDQRSLRTGQVNNRGIITSAYTTVVPKRNIDPSFAAYLLHGLDLMKVFYAQGGGVRQSMKYADLRRLPLGLPPIDEQCQIVAFLDRETAKVDEGIAKQERLITLLNEKRQSVISHAVTKGLDPNAPMHDSGIEWVGKCPQHWCVSRLKNTVTCCKNGTWGEDPEESNEAVLCVRVADFDYGRGRVSGRASTMRAVSPREARTLGLKRGDLLLEKSGGGEQSPVGRVVMYDLPSESICSNFVAFLRPAEDCASGFLCYLHSVLYAGRMNVKSIKQSIGIQNLDSYAYLCEPVALPGLPEQEAITRFLDREMSRIESTIMKAQQSVKLMREHRAALISAAVTGKIDVREIA